MKISRLNNINKQYLENSIKPNKSSNKDVKKNDIVNIEISDTAKTLVNTISNSEDAGISERVEAIRQSIISGTYKVSPEEIADKIVELIDSEKGSGSYDIW